MDEIFESAINSVGNFAGVFEFDGEAAYFYLYCMDESEGNKVVGANRIAIDNLRQEDIEIEWSDDNELVFLLVSGEQVAAFNCISRIRYGGMDGEHLNRDILERMRDMKH